MKKVIGLSMACLLLATGPASALVFQLGRSFAGPQPANNPPWLRIDMANEADGTVLVTMSCDAPSPQLMCDVWMNFDSDPLYANLLNGLYVIPVSGQATPTLSMGANAFQSDSDGCYDLLFAFPDGVKAPPDEETGISTFRLASTGGALFDTLFDFMSHPADGSNGRHGAVARFQGVAGLDNAWVRTGMPTPVRLPDSSQTSMLLGSALLALGVAGRRIAR
jgi:hypothetical protein